VLLYEVRQRLYETAAQHGCPATVTQRSSDQHQPRPATTPIALQPYAWACWHSSHTISQHESAKGARVVYAEDLRRVLFNLLHRDLFRGPGGLGVPCGSLERSLTWIVQTEQRSPSPPFMARGIRPDLLPQRLPSAIQLCRQDRDRKGAARFS
jgi:hypothetical protein